MSRTLLAWAFLALIALSGFVSVVRAEETEDSEEVEDNQEPEKEAYEADEDTSRERIGASADIVSSFLFPGNEDSSDIKLRLGDRSSVLIHLHNKGDREYNVTHIGAHLHSRYNFHYYIQNFTPAALSGVLLSPGEEASLEYKFKPDESLEAIDFWFSTWVVYNNTNDQFITYVYNSTITLTDQRPQDIKWFFNRLLVVAVLAVIGYAVVKIKGPGKKRSQPRVETGSRESTVPIYKPSEKAKAIKRRK